MMISYLKRVHIVFPCSQHSNTQSRQEFISCFAGVQIIEYSLPICHMLVDFMNVYLQVLSAYVTKKKRSSRPLGREVLSCKFVLVFF